MIIDAILAVLLSPINAFIEVIPTVDPLPANVSNNLVGIINNVSCFVPVATFFTCMGLWLVIANLDIIIAFVHWIIRKIPGVQ